MVIINEENKDLRGKLFPIPKGVKRHLEKTLSDYQKKDGNKNNDGYDRLVFLCGEDRISTEELKRIKNFFDHYSGTEKSDDYVLNGGKEMSDWVNRILKVATDTIKNQKEAKELMGLGSKKGKVNTDNPKVEKLSNDKIQTKNLSNSISKNSAVKESKTVYISEQQYRTIKEAMNPDTFSFEKLEEYCLYDSQLKTNKAYEYCVKELGEPSGLGTSRAVFDLDDNKVLKLSKTPSNVLQNVNEVKWTEQLNSEGIDIITKIFNHSEDCFWLVSESVVPCRTNDFEHILGIPMYAYGERGNINDKYTEFFGNHTEYTFNKDEHTIGIANRYICIDGFIGFITNEGKYTRPTEKLIYNDLLKNNQWFSQLAKLIKMTKTCDLHTGNFGMVNRNGKPIIVVLDLGL
jgi:hypothetical protein